MTEEKSPPPKKKLGRPRTLLPKDDEEIHRLGEELVAWAVDNPKKEKYHLTQWFLMEKMFSPNLFHVLEHNEIFIPYLKIAKAHLSFQYVNGTINPSIAHRFMRLYFDDVKKDENDLIAYKAEVARKNQEDSHNDLIQKLSEALRECDDLDD